MRKSTPWGEAQQAEELAAGIISYSTASHGGIWLSSARQKELNYHKNWLGTEEWWEEDCDWAIPFYYFREDILQHIVTTESKEKEYFDRNLEAAINTIKNYAPEFAAHCKLI
jgi:hypothetical protein